MLLLQAFPALDAPARAKLEAATRPDDETATTTFLSHHKKGADETAANLKKLFDKDLSDAMGKPESTNYLDVENLAVIDLQNLIRAVRSTDVLVLLLSSAQLPCPVLCLARLLLTLACCRQRTS